MNHRRIRPKAGFHRISAALVISFLARHRADQTDRSHFLSGALQAAGELHAVQRGINGSCAAGDARAGMRVERLQLAWSALQPENDDRLGVVARLPGASAARASKWLTGVSHVPRRRRPCVKTRGDLVVP